MSEETEAGSEFAVPVDASAAAVAAGLTERIRELTGSLAGSSSGSSSGAGRSQDGEILAQVLTGLAWHVEQLGERLEQASGSLQVAALADDLQRLQQEQAADQEQVYELLSAMGSKLDPGVIACCDSCGAPARCAGRPCRWPTRAVAVAELSGRAWGWSATSELLVCAGCLAARVCATTGHDWDTWADLGSEDLSALGFDAAVDSTGARTAGEPEWSARQCLRCCSVELGWAGSLGPRVQMRGWLR